MVFVISILIAFLLAESTYCFVRKQRLKKRKEDVISDENTDEERSFSVLIYIVSLANDITFLFTKMIGYFPSHIIRKLIYKYVLHMTIGKKTVIYYGLEARSPWNIVIGNNSIIGDHAILDGRNRICIGDNVNFSTGVWVWTEQHSINSPSFGVDGNKLPVIVKNRAWVSSRTNILPGSVIEEGTVIAAGAVLTGTKTKSFSIYGGVPAKYIGSREKKLTYQFDGKHRKFL